MTIQRRLLLAGHHPPYSLNGPVAMHNPMVSSVSLIVIRCADLAVSKAFYEALGLALTAEQHGTGPAHFSCAVGPVVVELYPRTDPVAPMRLGLRVPNVALSVERALLAGGRCLRAQTDSASSALLEDPNGHRIELTEDPAVFVAASGNTEIPAILTLEQQGWLVTRELRSEGEVWRAERGASRLMAPSPLQLLGLSALVQIRGESWAASDDEFDGAFRRFRL